MLEVGRVVIGRERGVTSFPPYTSHVTCQKTGSGSKNVKIFYLFYFCTKKENLPDRVLQAGTWARTECHGGRPLFCHTTKQNKKQNNVTDVLLGLPTDRDGPCPIGAVLHRIGHSFHRGCRIVDRIERLEQWWVDLGVSEHEADWACFACLGTSTTNRTFFWSCE